MSERKGIIDVLAPKIEAESAKKESGSYAAFFTLKNGGQLTDSVKLVKLERVDEK